MTASEAQEALNSVFRYINSESFTVNAAALAKAVRRIHDLEKFIAGCGNPAPSWTPIDRPLPKRYGEEGDE